MEDFVAFLRKYKWRILAVCFGVVLAMLFFTLGFWKTVLLCLIVAVCYGLGRLLDEGGRAKVGEFFSALFKSGNH